MPEVQGTVLEISLKALAHNYQFLRSRLREHTKFMAVVKAFAYGSDAAKIAGKLELLGVDYFAVAYIDEGVALRKEGIKSPILVLHPQPLNFKSLIDNCLEPNIYSFKILSEFLDITKRQGQKDYPVHLKFNTGLNRLGFSENDVDGVLEKLKGRNEISVKSIFSHLAASEDLNESEFTKGQIAKFDRIANEVESKFGYRPMRHLLNTSGIINYPDAQYDMVRSGIGLYGFGNHAAIDKQLKPVATLKTIISQIHKIEPGDSVGYNRSFTSKDYKFTATLPLGHADGIGRQYGNGKVFVNVNGQKAPIIGNTCMDMIMIDITGMECKEGDEVIIFGESPNANEFASSANTISYELLTGISQRVKRSIIE